jgi:2-polyprenyl-3-methyl-5-hydroxy-6-metoxy-1,4-benzoquinol methylase
MNYTQSLRYFSGINFQLLDQVPITAEKILEIGCGFGNFGEQVKARNPKVKYYAIEKAPDAAKVAETKLDHVFCVDVESELLIDDQFDCIIFGDVLEHLHNPLEILRKTRTMLKQDGCILCSVPNIQHHSIITSLLSGEFQYQDVGLLDNTHIRFFTYASFIKLLLDAGFIPQIANVITSEAPIDFLNTLKNSINFVKQDFERTKFYMNVYQYIFKGNINTNYIENEPEFPISFIVPTNDGRCFNDNFMSSPIFKNQHIHQIIALNNQPSAAEALENGIKFAKNDFIVYTHQDAYLPHKWDAVFTKKVNEAKTLDVNASMFGVYGAKFENGSSVHHGCVMDRHCYLNNGSPFPANVDSLDELLFGFEKQNYPGSDTTLGYHLYGADIACRYRELKKNIVAVDALCFHNSGLGFSLPTQFNNSSAIISKKWQKYLPLATPCMIIT